MKVILILVLFLIGCGVSTEVDKTTPEVNIYADSLDNLVITDSLWIKHYE